MNRLFVSWNEGRSSSSRSSVLPMHGQGLSALVAVGSGRAVGAEPEARGRGRSGDGALCVPAPGLRSRRGWSLGWRALGGGGFGQGARVAGPGRGGAGALAAAGWVLAGGGVA